MSLPRRQMLRFCGAVAVLRARPIRVGMPAIIHMRSDADGAQVTFDPVGLLVQPGQTVRFMCDANYHTTAAYHPANAHHSLRIPRRARPWSSDVLQPGDQFDVTLSVPGVYDYFCAPHEAAGMVGRLIVGQPTGPGSQPFDWFEGQAEGRDWLPVPPAAQRTFPSIDEIMRQGSVPARLADIQAGQYAVLIRSGVRPGLLSRDGVPAMSG